jgi:hypothetical protein
VVVDVNKGQDFLNFLAKKLFPLFFIFIFDEKTPLFILTAKLVVTSEDYSKFFIHLIFVMNNALENNKLSRH